MTFGFAKCISEELYYFCIVCGMSMNFDFLPSNLVWCLAFLLSGSLMLQLELPVFKPISANHVNLRVSLFRNDA